MSSSYVELYLGGRGSGKTLSMSVQALLDMLNGKQCWANYPIRFKYRSSDGVVTEFSSHKLEIEDLITFKPDIRDGVICLDELNLWASSRGSMSVVNRLLNSWIQLIRKRKLDIYIACQLLNTLDRIFRDQCDVVIECFDMSHKFRSLPEGALIYHTITDWSGLFTGRPIMKWDNLEERGRNTRYRYLNARRFWGIYDSWTEFDILQALTQYQVKREVRVIDQAGNALTFEPAPNIDMGNERLGVLRDWLKQTYPGGISREDMAKGLREGGYGNTPSEIKKVIWELGAIEKKDGYQFP